MSVRIELDNSTRTVFTCLDYVSGKVILNLPSDDTVSSITVKMEGISRTRLEPPRLEVLEERPREKRRAEVEIHRLLYVVQTVFPSEAIRENTTSNTGFTLKGGQYEYPFRIRIPINSSCTLGAAPGTIAGGLLQKVSFDMSKGTLDYARDSNRHVKGTLPPSLSGIPGDIAWIKYFLKATSSRPQFYKANMRQHDPFVFLPIEPPRPPPTVAETFARRKHEFITVPKTPASATKKTSFLSVFRKEVPSSSTPTIIPVRFTIEARLPSPPILVPNDPLPLRLLLTKLDPFKEVIVMRTLQVTLLANTRITAHELYKDELTQYLLLSVADLHVPFGSEDAPPNVTLEADPSLWRDRAVPDSVSPSFTTCNIKRSYQLKIEIGLSRAGEQHYDIVSLIFEIEIYSGIRPPQQLIDSAYRPPPMQPPRAVKTNSSLTVPTHSIPPQGEKGERKGSFSTNTSPMASPVSPTLPDRPHSSYNPPTHDNDGYVDLTDSAPPPTYEDAIADGIEPVDGPRRRYQQEGAYYQALPDDLNAR
ncbi:hypothetical protein K440DRAFT_532269 [Wilcoxina mikolae CBS 423.85]|nr:hypothetical protein K440DRAFT_532269 [Wilcoxina mikolae CBS 423.85]